MLGIESSCDDTGAAVVRGDGTVLGEVLASQAGVHEVWGGVVPSLAQEAHRKAIDATVDEALGGGLPAGRLTEVVSAVASGGGQTLLARLIEETRAALGAVVTMTGGR